MSSKRIFILMGQGGWLTSSGMNLTATALRPHGEVTIHSWNDPGVLPDIQLNATLGRTIVVIGYSLGANQLGWLSKYVKRDMALGIAIDPSKQSPIVERHESGDYVQYAPRFRRLVCFYHPQAWIFGGSRYEGDNVENIPVSGTHLGFQFDPNIRSTILKEVSAL